jgi:hypothetical protein
MKWKFFFLLLVLPVAANSYTENEQEIVLNIKLYLQGCYKNNLMSDELNKENLLPLSQPYNVTPWEYKGGEQVDKIPAGVVDWILVELSTDTDGVKVIARQAAFLKTDGTVTSLDGRSPIIFEKVDAKECYIVVRHRNHLPVMSDKLIPAGTEIFYAFTTDMGKAFGNSLADLGDGNYGLISGDSNSDGDINDLDFKEVAGNLLKVGYLNEDLDMNGVVNILDYKKTNINISKKTAFR